MALSLDEKKEVERLIIEDCNNYYYNTEYVKSGKWSAKQVYETFKDDPLWYVKYNKHGWVSFRERKEKENSKREWKSTMMLFVHQLTKHKWRLSSHEAQIVIYGGFARSAMIALLNCKSAVYESILCLQKCKIPNDIIKMILRPLLNTWCDDFSWFLDKVRDIDVLVSYRDRYKPGRLEFETDISYIKENLDSLCSRTSCGFHKEDLRTSKSNFWDANSHRHGISSFRDGDFYNYLVTFNAIPYQGERVSKLYRRPIYLDITTMIGDDRSDVDVNNLVLYFDTNQKRFNFGQRKRLLFPDGEVQMSQIVRHIQRRQFRHVPLDYKTFDNFGTFKQAYNILYRRVDSLEYRGWKQDPKYPKLDEKMLDRACTYFKQKEKERVIVCRKK